MPFWRYMPIVTKSICAACMAMIALLIIPLEPWFSTEDWVDVSAIYALNEATSRGLIFGHDVVTTHGPLSSVYTRMYHPGTDRIMLIGSTWVTLGFCVAFWLLAIERKPLLLLSLPIVVAGSQLIMAKSLWVNDVFFLAIPLLLVLLAYRLSSHEDDLYHLAITRSSVLGLGVTTSAVGLFPLIKANYGVLAVCEVAVAVAILSFRGNIKIALGVSLLFPLTLVLTWAALGQPISALVDYFQGQYAVIGGYSEAMAGKSSYVEIFYWAMAAALITITFYVGAAKAQGAVGSLAVLAVSLYLFMNFKHGFMGEHPIIWPASLILLAMGVATLIKARQAVAVIIIALISIGVSRWTASATVLGNPTMAFNTIASGLHHRIADRQYFGEAFATANVAIRHSMPLPNFVGTTDAYPGGAALLFAHQIPWSGRPTLVSYMAYQAELDRKNAAHLKGPSAPDNVIFAVDPIADRLPSTEDALSWLVLLDEYTITGKGEKYLYMARRLPSRHTTPVALVNLDTNVGAPIMIPAVDDAVTAQIQMRPTLLGRFVQTAFKLPPVHMEIHLSNGKVFVYRYVPAMGETGFLLSPLIRSVDDFLALAAGRADDLRVARIRLLTPSAALWRKTIHVTLNRNIIAPQPIAAGLIVSSTTHE